MPEKSESARTTIILAVCTVVLGFYVLIFGLQTLVSIEAHRWALSSPFLKAVPQPLPTTIASEVQDRDLQFYGYTFAAPWKDGAKKEEGDARSEMDFPLGPIIIFFNPATEADIVGKIRGGDLDVLHSYEAIFGRGFFPDNYAMYAAVYGAAPNQVWPFTPRARAVRIDTLLIWKLRFSTYGRTTIYSIQTNNMRGFQFGDPSRDRFLLVHLFDDSGGQVRILFTSKSGQPGTIPQADLNCVIYSLRSAYSSH